MAHRERSILISGMTIAIQATNPCEAPLKQSRDMDGKATKRGSDKLAVLHKSLCYTDGNASLYKSFESDL